MATGGLPAQEEMHNEEWAPPAAAPGTPQREAVGLGVGVGQYHQEGQVLNDSPMTRDPRVRVSANESPVPSSASDVGSTMSRFVTRRDFQRVKRRLVKMSDHLRDSLQTTTTELWVAIDDEVYERKQAPPTTAPRPFHRPCAPIWMVSAMRSSTSSNP